jgi:hypothetical protein
MSSLLPSDSTKEGDEDTTRRRGEKVLKVMAVRWAVAVAMYMYARKQRRR